VPEVTLLPGELTVAQVLHYGALLVLPYATTRAARAARISEVVAAMDLQDVLTEPLNRDPDSSLGQTKIHCAAVALELLRAPRMRLPVCLLAPRALTCRPSLRTVHRNAVSAGPTAPPAGHGVD
jgi:hypothetical protein